ncbi:MAG: hypothetical protein Q8Q56_01765 [Alphaproteobacteria bacterium]|nr:hypothetical protein [Alphaproteobacteria bacterium]
MFLAKEAVSAKLTETGKDRFDIVFELGVGWTIFAYYMFDSIISFVQNPTKNIFFIIIGVFILLTLTSYYSGKAKVNRRKNKSH